MRPIDLAREHGLTAQAVRNYEAAGALPGAERSPHGHRRYTERHAAALRAFLALVRAIGHRPALEIMNAVGAGELDRALMLLDRAHEQMLRDRATLSAVQQAIRDLDGDVDGDHAPPPPVLRIGDVAGRLGLSPATLRHWEGRGLLSPRREPVSGHRLYPSGQVRDAELIHLLRRGGHPLGEIAAVLAHVRGHGEITAAHTALEASRDRVTARGVALVRATAALAVCLEDVTCDEAAPQ